MNDTDVTTLEFVRLTVRPEEREAFLRDRAPVRAAGEELDRLLRLGELHRAAGRPVDADGAMRALERAARTLTAT